MCGLSGILISPGRTKAQLQRISDFFIANLVANEERGREASGVALLNSDSSWLVDKAPLTASRYVRTQGFKDVISTLSPDTTLLLGHTREPTKGTPEKNVNNHPIVSGSIVGVHNGTIDNDDFIFQNHAQGSDRIGSVDSEAVFALLDTISGEMDKQSYGQRVHDISRLLVGSYTILYFTPASAYRVFLLKYKNPISVHWDENIGALFFSSRYIFLRKTFGRSVVTEALPPRTGYVFDARKLTQRGKQPISTFPLADRTPSPPSGHELAGCVSCT